nr:LuxR C-terminal-related transcriptional regulator [Kibdelosporangium sp. MJ126-NF4]CEL19943.1 Transcriptional activator [Kibdelosporangium sp. MJ126-NF4]CTQ97167.1 Transcriptional activator [Kibdelosporangium sp. MJ126-NF4]
MAKLSLQTIYSGHYGRAAIHGRDEYIEKITAILRRVAGASRSTTVVVEGAPGSGKTRLLAKATELAENQGFTTFTGVYEQLGRPEKATEKAAALAHAGAQAPTGTDLIPVPEGTSAHANQAYAQLVDLLPHSPVLVPLDNFHRAGPAVMLTVRALMTKLRTQPVVWLLSFPPGNRGSLAALLGHEITEAEQLPELPPLAPAAIRSVATDLLGAIPSPPLLSILESVTIPGPLVELIRGLVDDRDVEINDGVADLTPRATGTAVTVPGQPEVELPAETPLPERFVTMVTAKLDALAAPTRQLLQVAAVLGRDFTPVDLAAMLGKSPAELLPLVHEVMHSGLITVDADDAFAFSSAPLRQAALDTVPKPIRVMLHRQAAQILMERPSGRLDAAIHLARGALPGDAEATRTLIEVSGELLAVDPARAADLATGGMRLCGPGTTEYLELAAIAAQALTRSGSLSAAIRFCRQSLENTDADTPQTQTLRRWLATALFLRGHAAAATATAKRLLESPSCVDPIREQVEVLRLTAESLSDERAAMGRADELLVGTEPLSQAVSTAARSVLALSRWRNGQVTEALDMTTGNTGDGAWFSNPTWLRVSLLTRARRLDEATHLLSRIGVGHEDTGCVITGVPAILSAAILLADGDLHEAAIVAGQGLTAAQTYDMPLYAPQAAAVLAMVALHQGDLVAAKRHCGQANDLLAREEARPWWAANLLVQGMVAAGTDDSSTVENVLSTVRADAGIRREVLLEDPAAAAWFVRVATEHHGTRTAESVVDTAEALSRANPGHDFLKYAAWHARALLDGDIGVLAEVARAHVDPLSRAHAGEDLGTALCDEDRDTAVEQLDRAMDAYSEIDATWHAARVTRRLRALGVRRRNWKHTKRPVTGWDSLTETERKVATLVAKGLTNRQAAGHLFVSPHTVGYHLRQIFRKLEIGSRIELINLKN